MLRCIILFVAARLAAVVPAGCRFKIEEVAVTPHQRQARQRLRPSRSGDDGRASSAVLAENFHRARCRCVSVKSFTAKRRLLRMGLAELIVTV